MHFSQRKSSMRVSQSSDTHLSELYHVSGLQPWCVRRVSNVKNNYSKLTRHCTHRKNFCMQQSNTSDECAFMWLVLHLEGCVTFAYFWKSFLTRELMESFYKRNYRNVLVMVNMDVHLTHLVKVKLDRPNWELIGNRRQHTHLFRIFLYLMLLFAEGMCSWKCVRIVKVCNVKTFVLRMCVRSEDVFLQKFCLFTFLIKAPVFIHQKYQWAHFLHSIICTTCTWTWTWSLSKWLH
jgi:hypothetical protein